MPFFTECEGGLEEIRGSIHGLPLEQSLNWKQLCVYIEPT